MLPSDEGGWRHRRKTLGLNQSEFWSRVGVEQSVGSRYETGRLLPQPVRLLLELAFGQPAMAAEVYRNLRANAANPYLRDDSQLRAYRQERGLSLSQFWSPLGIQRSVASRYETSRRVPRQVLLLLKLSYGTPAAARAALAKLQAGQAVAVPAEVVTLPTWSGERRRSEDRRQCQIPLPAWQVDRRQSSDRRLAS